MQARDVIRLLELEPHPEGGWYRQTFRDDAGGERGHSTAIYYLLERGQRSHWHKVTDAAEVWHYHAGAPLRLRSVREGAMESDMILGPNIAAGERPQAVIPANVWQSAESTGDYTLVGCTVAPGFEFSSFVMAPPGWEPGKADISAD